MSGGVAGDYLRHFGYLEDGAAAEADVGQALKRFQQCFGIAQTGQPDEPTMAAMAWPRCGVPDPQPGVRILAAGDAWQKQNLTWRIDADTEKVPRSGNAMRMAFRIWASFTPLTFTAAAADEDADIVVRFDLGAHGDGRPHDGPGNVLAHAYFPPPLSVGDELAGDMHFDEGEAWTVRMPIASNEQDLVTVALHEIGHSLGLSHSFGVDDIMFPAIRGVQRQLSDNDISRVQALYGDGHDGQGNQFDLAGLAALWYTGPDALHCLELTPVSGRRIRSQAAGVWQDWTELGGEYEPTFTVNPTAVPFGGETIVFARSYQKHLYAQHLGAQPGPLHFLGGRRASAFYAAGMAGLPTVFLISPTRDPDKSLDHPPEGSFLIERSFDGATLTEWLEVTNDVSVLPAVASRPGRSSTLVVADRNGQLRSTDGFAGEWGGFEPLPSHPPVQLDNAFWPVSATYTTDDILDVTLATAERELLHARRTGGSWSGWHSFGQAWNRGYLVSDGVGNVHLVADRHEGKVFRTKLDPAGWGDWQSIGDRVAVAALAAQPGRVDLLLARPNRRGTTHHTFAP